MTQGNIFNSFAQSIQGGHAMKRQISILGTVLWIDIKLCTSLFCDITIEKSMRITYGNFLIPRRQQLLCIQEMDCMQSTMWLHFCSCFSYAIRKISKLLEELISLALPALLLLVTGSIMTNLFLWVYTNSSYCIPFGAMLLSVFLYRIYAYEIRGK